MCVTSLVVNVTTLPVSVFFDNVRRQLNATFEYVENPTVTSISPLSSFAGWVSTCKIAYLVLYKRLYWLYLYSVRVVNEKGTGAPSAESARIELGMGSLPSGEGPGEMAVPIPRNFFFSFVWQWCILVACFNVSIRRVKVKTESKSSFVCQLVSYISHGGRMIHDIIHTNTYNRAVRHTWSLHYGHTVNNSSTVL